MPVKIFFCYSHKDERLLNKFKTHIKPLQREGLIDMWDDRDISVGTEWEREIDKHLSADDIILLLISPDFMDSDYCYSIEMKKAVERHERGEAVVVPIILRPVDWRGAPFGKLQALPKDAKPITDWVTQDSGFHNATQGIRKVVEELNIKRSVNSAATSEKTARELSSAQSTITQQITAIQTSEEVITPASQPEHPIPIATSSIQLKSTKRRYFEILYLYFRCEVGYAICVKSTKECLIDLTMS